MKVAYLIVSKTFPGLLKQVAYDRRLTDTLEGMEWSHFTFLDEVAEGEEAQKLPVFCKGVFGSKLFAWLWMLKHARRYDYVIVRHMVFDPFALLFAWFVPNRVLVHHSKEVLELRQIRQGWKGRAASWLENITGRVATRSARAIVAVTREVGAYQKQFRKLPDTVPVGFFPNGIIVDTMPLLEDARPADRIVMGFMCGSFTAWHGLDRLLRSLLDYYAKHSSPYPLRLELIGRLNEAQLAQIAEVNDAAPEQVIFVHGRLPQEAYLHILKTCHIGIGSLAMDRIELLEGATLKVREMLGMGLPLYSGHVDTALPQDFPYYVNGAITVPEIIEFARRTGDIPRDAIREASRPYIDKRVWIEELARFLKALRGAGGR